MAFPTTSTILDNFNRADGYLTSPWALGHSYLGSNLMLISTNQLRGSGSYIICYWNSSTYGANVEGYVTVVVNTTISNDGPYLCARLQQPGTGTLDGYCVAIENSGHSWKILRIDNGVTTQLGATVDPSSASGDKAGIEIIGSTITAYRYNGTSWSSVASRSDSTYSGTGYLGLYGGSDDNAYRLDDFGGGTVIADTGKPKPAKLIRYQLPVQYLRI